MGRLRWTGLGIIGLLAVAACTVSPTGRQQLMLVSPSQLNGAGNQAFAEITRKKGTVSGAPSAYVNCIVQNLSQALPNGAPRQWDIAVIRDDQANAFALPGAKIGVQTGMFNVARDQHQLAAVIAHEIAHVLSNHASERLSQQLAVKGGLTALSAFGGGQSGMSPQTIQALGLGAQYGILLPYGRVQESEADIFGLELMARAGFDPRASIALWQNMSQANRAQPPEFLSTHPSHGTRIGELQQQMNRAMSSFQQAQTQGRRPSCR